LSKINQKKNIDVQKQLLSRPEYCMGIQLTVEHRDFQIAQGQPSAPVCLTLASRARRPNPPARSKESRCLQLWRSTHYPQLTILTLGN